ncbi:MAG: hypothetical protein AB2L20_11870 [Mangrovibacterium sp.]
MHPIIKVKIKDGKIVQCDPNYLCGFPAQLDELIKNVSGACSDRSSGVLVHDMELQIDPPYADEIKYDVRETHDVLSDRWETGYVVNDRATRATKYTLQIVFEYKDPNF